VSKRRVWWSREFTLAAIARIETTPTLHGLAVELGIRREMLLKWRRAYEAGGAAALNLPGQRHAAGRARQSGASRRMNCGGAAADRGA
jgi:transposase-like protein